MASSVPGYSEVELAEHYYELTHHAGVLGFGLERAPAEAIEAWVAFLTGQAANDGLRVEHREAFWHDWNDQFVLLVSHEGNAYDLPLRGGAEARRAAAERDWGETLLKARGRAAVELLRRKAAAAACSGNS